MESEAPEIQQTEVHPENQQNLEHILEETCESIDSMGRGHSTHTMKSNFGLVMSVPPIGEVKRKRSNMRFNKSHQSKP
jgi:hypothetical protein